jgi:hypothetical protein
MLHRLALRVLPSLTLAVTDEQTRKRKRLVMLVPGLVAFAVYRGVKHVLPLSDPAVLLGVSGVISAVTAVCAYRIGREVSMPVLWRQDGARRMAWLAGWIGFFYGVQLSLLVLALLKILAHYDFLRHPEGPAMMAIIIACTSVARDAFEIGHVRRLQCDGKPFVTFPDGTALWGLIGGRTLSVMAWALAGAFTCILVSFSAEVAHAGRSHIVQLVAVTLVAGTVSLWAYLGGEQRLSGWRIRMAGRPWSELLRFWWWPGLAFGATYYMVMAGMLIFILRTDEIVTGTHGAAVGAVGGLMAVYGYYLGYRRSEEDRIQRTVPASLLRCPFVMGILSKTNGRDRVASSEESVAAESARPV